MGKNELNYSRDECFAEAQERVHWVWVRAMMEEDSVVLFRGTDPHKWLRLHPLSSSHKSFKVQKRRRLYSDTKSGN